MSFVIFSTEKCDYESKQKTNKHVGEPIRRKPIVSVTASRALRCTDALAV